MSIYFDYSLDDEEFRKDPELAAIYVLEGSLRLACAALMAAHPKLFEGGFPTTTTINDVRLQAGSNVILMTKALLIFIEHYTDVVAAQNPRRRSA